MVGANGTTTDGYASGVADLDCFGERFFYVLANPYSFNVGRRDRRSLELRQHRQSFGRRRARVQPRLRLDRQHALWFGPLGSTAGGTNVQLIAINPSTGAVETS